MASLSDPVAPLRGYPFAIVASVALWLAALIALALLFRMDGKSLGHSVRHHAYWAATKVKRDVPRYRALIWTPPPREGQQRR